MPFLPILAQMLISTLGSMLMSLVTKNFLKKIIIFGLEKIVKATDSDADDKLLQAAKLAWEESNEKAK